MGPEVAQSGSTSLTGDGKDERVHHNCGKPNSGSSQAIYGMCARKKKEETGDTGTLMQGAGNDERRGDEYEAMCENG